MVVNKVAQPKAQVNMFAGLNGYSSLFINVLLTLRWVLTHLASKDISQGLNRLPFYGCLHESWQAGAAWALLSSNLVTESITWVYLTFGYTPLTPPFMAS